MSLFECCRFDFDIELFAKLIRQGFQADRNRRELQFAFFHRPRREEGFQSSAIRADVDSRRLLASVLGPACLAADRINVETAAIEFRIAFCQQISLLFAAIPIIFLSRKQGLDAPLLMFCVVLVQCPSGVAVLLMLVVQGISAYRVKIITAAEALRTRPAIDH